MSIYNQQFYTYLIGWSTHKKYYYGVRYKLYGSPKDLWTKYFTSSKYVKKFREEYGEPDVIQIRKIFKSANSAREWEHKVLKRMKVVKHEKFLNRNDGKSYTPMYGVNHWAFGKVGNRKGKKVSEEGKAKIRAATLRQFANEDTRKRVFEARRKVAEEQRGKYIWINNGIVNKRILKNEPISDSSWILGRFSSKPHYKLGMHLTEEHKQYLRDCNIRQFSDEIRRAKHLEATTRNNPARGKIWINNGIDNKRVSNSAYTSEYSGWNIGRIISDECKNKMKNNRTTIHCSITGRFIKTNENQILSI